jgi:hypothetical protein
MGRLMAGGSAVFPLLSLARLLIGAFFRGVGSAWKTYFTCDCGGRNDSRLKISCYASRLLSPMLKTDSNSIVRFNDAR